MSTRLSPTSYLVLGLVAGMGPVTPYEMKQMVGASLGYFWSFPHSQLYAEPDRLVDAGLLRVDQEDEGRRRKRYSITEEGRDALTAWLSDPETEPGETREPGLLKLFFGGLGEPDDMVGLARSQAELYRARIAEYEAIEAAISGDPAFRYPLLTLHLGMAVARASLEFWDDLASRSPED